MTVKTFNAAIDDLPKEDFTTSLLELRRFYNQPFVPEMLGNRPRPEPMYLDKAESSDKGKTVCPYCGYASSLETMRHQCIIHQWEQNETKVLFEGWSLQENSFESRVYSKKNEWIYIFPSRGYEVRFRGIMPFGTLDDFIRDCVRFGVDLTWKKEVGEKISNQPSLK